MFPKEIIDILIKYQNDSDSVLQIDNSIRNINTNIYNIIAALKQVQLALTSKLNNLTAKNVINEGENELLIDLQVLRKYIGYIDGFSICKTQLSQEKNLEQIPRISHHIYVNYQ